MRFWLVFCSFFAMRGSCATARYAMSTERRGARLEVLSHVDNNWSPHFSTNASTKVFALRSANYIFAVYSHPVKVTATFSIHANMPAY